MTAPPDGVPPMTWCVVHLSNKQQWQPSFLVYGWATKRHTETFPTRALSPPLPTPQHKLSSRCSMSWYLSWAAPTHCINQPSKLWEVFDFSFLLNIKSKPNSLYITIILISQINKIRKIKLVCDIGLHLFHYFQRQDGGKSESVLQWREQLWMLLK